MRLFRDQFQDGFIIQRGLLRLGQPGFAERLKSRQIVRRHGVCRQQRRAERELRPRVGVEPAGFKQLFGTLKRGEGRARLRTDGSVN